MPLAAGRDFDDHDTPQAPLVAVVTESFVRQFFPKGDALGQTFQVAEDPGAPRPSIKIVGIVKDSKYAGMREPFAPLVYLNGDQDTEFDDTPRFVLHASTARPGVTAAATRNLVDLNGSVVVHYQSLRSLVNATLVRDRLMATLSGFFGLLAGLIATIGLYGVMAYTVARRRVEIGIRLALGADRGSVVRLVAREAAVLLVCG